MVMADNTMWAFEILFAARRTDVHTGNAAFLVQGGVKRDTGVASAALVGTVTTTVLARDFAAWTVTVDADTTNGSLRLQVTGEAAKTIYWVAFLRTVEITG